MFHQHDKVTDRETIGGGLHRRTINADILAKYIVNGTKLIMTRYPSEFRCWAPPRVAIARRRMIRTRRVFFRLVQNRRPCAILGASARR